MKNKFLVLSLALLLSFATFGFVACAPKDPGTTGGTDITGGTGNNGNSGNGGTTNGGTDTEKSLVAYSTNFSNIKTEYNNATIKDHNNSTVSFDEAIDTQIDVLAQDVMYRLVYTYGDYNGSQLYNRSFDFNLLDLDGGFYDYNNQKANVDQHEFLLTNYVEQTASEFDITDVNSIQYDFNNNGLNTMYPGTLIFPGAINGYYTEITTSTTDQIAGTQLTSNAWNYDLLSQGQNQDATELFISKYKNNFKMAIAQILTGATVTGSYNQTTYNTMLTKIDGLGFDADFAEKLETFIYEKVIGTSLTNIDLVRYNYIVDNNLTNLGKDFVFLNKTKDNNPDAKLYKGYNVIVPAIVDTALKNTFDGSKSIYPTVSRSAVEVVSQVEANAYTAMVFMPSKSVKTTEFVITAQGTGTAVGKTVSTKVVVNANGKEYSKTISIALTSSKTEIEIDLAAFTNGATLGVYDGTKTSVANTSVFSASTSINSDNQNYIRLEFDNSNNYEFVVTPVGMYNK